MSPKILITSALPYANGPIHIGHLVEYVQTDIFVRFLKSSGRDVTYLCADDTHGTPIQINAAKQGLQPEQFIERFYLEHQQDFKDFDIQFDWYGSTNSAENKKFSELIYQRLKDAGEIDRRDVEQAYCEKDQRFLPDRFIRGTCPFCKTADQYGDVCEKCSKTYAPTDLIDPRCDLCGTTPVRKKSAHLFFRLSRHAEFLRSVLKDPQFIESSTAHQLNSFFEKGLNDWDISRDGPYFGFEIPGETNKYFYVWLDAPIGYISTTEKWAKETGKVADAWAFWGLNADSEIYHFIGKDIVYFHALFWPAVLKVAGLKQPNRLMVHGHLTVQGEKMSKTRGTSISARAYLDKMDPSYLRFFYAMNLGSGTEDLDFSPTEFCLRVNAELVNNIGNLANRALSLLAGPLKHQLALVKRGTDVGPGQDLVEKSLAQAKQISASMEKRDYRSAVKGIAEISQRANQFLQLRAPWSKIKSDPEGAREDLSDAAEIAYLLAGLLEPIVPRLSARLFEQLNAQPLTYSALTTAAYPLLDRARPIGDPSPLIARLDKEIAESLIAAPAGSTTAVPPDPVIKQHSEIEYAEFAKISLKVGRISAAERVPKADKLLKLTIDVGEELPRTIASGIAEFFSPEALVGRNVVVVANLKSRKIRGIESRGMLLAAGGEAGQPMSLVDPGSLPAGTEIS